jgi:hypothetical protein
MGWLEGKEWKKARALKKGRDHLSNLIESTNAAKVYFKELKKDMPEAYDEIMRSESLDCYRHASTDLVVVLEGKSE